MSPLCSYPSYESNQHENTNHGRCIVTVCSYLPFGCLTSSLLTFSLYSIVNRVPRAKTARPSDNVSHKTETPTRIAPCFMPRDCQSSAFVHCSTIFELGRQCLDIFVTATIPRPYVPIFMEQFQRERELAEENQNQDAWRMLPWSLLHFQTFTTRNGAQHPRPLHPSAIPIIRALQDLATERSPPHLRHFRSRRPTFRGQLRVGSYDDGLCSMGVFHFPHERLHRQAIHMAHHLPNRPPVS